MRSKKTILKNHLDASSGSSSCKACKQKIGDKFSGSAYQMVFAFESLSSSFYDALHSTGVLTLPSEWKLRGYIHWIKSKTHFYWVSGRINEQLIEESNVNVDKDQYAILVLDEITQLLGVPGVMYL